MPREVHRPDVERDHDRVVQDGPQLVEHTVDNASDTEAVEALALDLHEGGRVGPRPQLGDYLGQGRNGDAGGDLDRPDAVHVQVEDLRVNAGRASQVRVVQDDRHLVACELHVELDGADTGLQGRPDRNQRVLRVTPGVAPVRHEGGGRVLVVTMGQSGHGMLH